jgi:hypothetical protein
MRTVTCVLVLGIAVTAGILAGQSIEPSFSRWTWYTLVPNKVRQMAEQSADNQKTWNITWDSVYVKKN